MGISGTATVVAIEPLGEVATGPGRIVTATYSRTASELVQVWLADDPEPILVTRQHPIFVADEQGWVKATDLRTGDNLLSEDGETIQVTAVTEIPADAATQRVHTLEVDGEHRFFAGAQAVLVHNAFGKLPKLSRVRQVGGRLPINSKFAGTVMPVPQKLRGKYQHGIPFTGQGFADFSRYSIRKVQIKLAGRRDLDEAAANAAARYSKTPDGYTWHHHQVSGVMQLVPKDLHDLVRHTGGVAASGIKPYR